MAITLSTSANINCVSLVASVPKEDHPRFVAFRDSLMPVLKSEGCPFFVDEPQTRDELLAVFDALAARAREGLVPVLQLLMHGSAAKGLICADRTTVSWAETLEKLGTINAATANNLVVCSAVCYSLQVVTRLSISRPVPFYILLAPEHEAEMDFVENRTALFYSI